MSLIDDLRAAAPSIPPSLVPSPAELGQVVGALLLHVEHGDDFLKAAEEGHDGVSTLVQPEPPAPAPTAEQQAATAELETLRARLSVLEGNAGATTAEVTPG